MRPFAVLIVACFSLCAATALAAPASRNPFLSGAELSALRPGTSAATLKVTYGFTATEDGKVQNSSVVIDLADDWAMITTGAQTTLLDYRLGRLINLLPGRNGFSNFNYDTLLLFRVRERRSRAALEMAGTAAGVGIPIGDSCDAETELGIVVADVPAHLPATVESSADAATVSCGGRVVGTIELSKTGGPPATLWPSMFSAFQLHPSIVDFARKGGRVPSVITSSFARSGQPVELRWKLESVTEEELIYPVGPGTANSTVDSLASALPPAINKLAVDAVSGKAAGGIPDLAGWDAKLAALQKSDAADASLVLLPTIGMFPQAVTGCRTGARSAVCDVLGDIGTQRKRDPAVAAAYAIINVNPTDPATHETIIAALQAAKSSPHVGHPALAGVVGVAFAQGGTRLAKLAKGAGLQIDPGALTLEAINAYPYAACYWLDLSNLLINNWRIFEGMIVEDVAASLPMPSSDQCVGVAAKYHRSMAALYPGMYLQSP